MTAVYPRFVRALEDPTPLPRGARVRLAISGGPDSTALLVLFARLRERRRPDLVLSAGHIHHGLRGAEADADERACRALAARFGFHFVTAHVDVPSLARARRESFETAARAARLGFFRAWAEADRLDALATGHTADDQAETVLGNLLRGTGVRGLCGMAAIRPLAPGGATLLLRPLLEIERRELLALLAHAGIDAREDATNRDLSHRRNRLRHDLIPRLERDYNPRVRRILRGLAGDARRLDSLVRARTAAILATVEYGPSLARLSLAALRPLGDDPALLGPVLHEIWTRAAVERAGTESCGLTRDHHRAWCHLVRRGSDGAAYCLPGGWRLERAADWIYLIQVEAAPPPPDCPVRGEGATPLPWIGAEVRFARETGLPRDPAACILPADWLAPGAVVRTARTGDRIATRAGHQDVMDLMRARGVPDSLRRRMPLLESGGEPRWVPGLRRSDRGAAGAQRVSASLRVDPGHSPGAFLLASLLARGRP